MDNQAEDVMGSLLKEYLNVTQKEDEHPSDTNGTEHTSTYEKDSCMEDVTDSKNNDSNHDPENGNLTSESSPQSSVKEPEDEPQNKNNSEDEPQNKNNSEENENTITITKVQHFKNVVAIVDPPRGGLHPTVSNIFLLDSS